MKSLKKISKKILSILTAFIIILSHSATAMASIADLANVTDYKNYGVSENAEITNVKLQEVTLYDYNPQIFNTYIRGGKELSSPVDFEEADANRTLFTFGRYQSNHYGSFAAYQGIVENSLVNGNIVLTAGDNNNMKFFPEKSEVSNLIGSDKPYNEILENYNLPLIDMGQGWYRYDSYSTYLKRDSSNNKYKLYQGQLLGHSSQDGLAVPGIEIKGGFFPFNKTTYIDQINENNEYFGMKMEVDFSIYKNKEGKIVNSFTGEDVIFRFCGDDDMWVFIDGKLYLDIGGLHREVAGAINFTESKSIVEKVYNQEGEIINNVEKSFEQLEAGKHKMTIFYMERGGSDSNLFLEFNMQESIDIPVEKTWDDSNDKYELRPDSITVNLLQNGKKIDSKVVTAKDNWKCTFTNLLKYDENGKEYKYTITEDAIPQYETKINGYNIVNTLRKVDITGEKIWDDLDNKYNLRPESITINLLQNGNEIQEKVVTEKEEWKYTFKDLPKYDEDGKEYVYTITEDAVDKYETTIDGYNVTNKLITNYDLELQKWIVNYTKIVDGKEEVIESNQTYETTLEEKNGDKLVKIDLSEKDLDKTTVKIKYAIRVYNAGEVAGYVREITDFLPEGTEFYVEDNMNEEGKAFWKLEEGKLITSEAYKDELDKELQPGEEKIVYVTLRLKIDKENFGIKNNKAKITKNESTWGIPDINTGNDEDEVEFLVTVKTGETMIKFIAILTILGVSLVGALLIRRKIKRTI